VDLIILPSLGFFSFPVDKKQNKRKMDGELDLEEIQFLSLKTDVTKKKDNTQLPHKPYNYLAKKKKKTSPSYPCWIGYHFREKVNYFHEKTKKYLRDASKAIPVAKVRKSVLNGLEPKEGSKIWSKISARIEKDPRVGFFRINQDGKKISMWFWKIKEKRNL